MVREKIRSGLDKVSIWIHENRELAVAGGIVGIAIGKAVLKRVFAKPMIVYNIELKKED